MIQKNAEVIACSLPKIVGRRYEFMALFQNLIENGIKYNESGNPRIIIKTKALKDEFVIAFHDNGIGIEAAYYEKIFKFFKRLHTQEQYQGTGIGLSLCKKIVRKYDGDITVSSEVGKGTTFRIILPKKHIAE
jgi:light-regulated signal transduction histidine kinase (bacteriophytochrome)